MNRDVAVIGGGRWARVLVESLCGLVPHCTRIGVHTVHNAEAMLNWAASRGLSQRITVSATWPQLTGRRLPAVIIANAARDHRAAAQHVLRIGAPLLVEKPVVLNACDMNELMVLAESRQVQFAAAHVFLFARYMERFRHIVASAGPLRQVRLRWTDPRLEDRYGETKRYDPSLPVYADWLPHAMSIIGSILQEREPELGDLKFLRGGAKLRLKLAYGDTRCLLEFARNATRRERLLEVEAQDGKVYRLDFSLEPGIIEVAGIKAVADPDWDTMPRPVACMLTSFLNWADGGAADWRLDIQMGFLACQLIEQVGIRYRESKVAWLEHRLLTQEKNDEEDLHYALVELLQSGGALSDYTLDAQIDALRQELANLESKALRDRLLRVHYQ